MKKLFQPFVTLLLLAFIGCNPESELLLEKLSFPDESTDAETDVSLKVVSIDPEAICGEIVERPLLTGGGKSILGTLLIANDQEEIFFEFMLKECWAILETHIYIGPFNDMPVLPSGYPDYNEFPYTEIYDPLPLEVSIPIGIQDLSKNDDGDLTIVVHAKIVNNSEEVSVVKSVLAEWDGDLLFLGPRRGGGFYYEIQSCDIDPASSASNGDPVSGLDDEVLVFNYCGVDQAEWDLKNKKNDPAQVETLGTVLVSTDEENLIFNFSLEGDWMIESIHVNVGDFDQDQYNPAGTVPTGKYDFGESYVPAVAATLEEPYPFDVSLIEMVEELDNADCAIFYIVANLTREIIQDGVVIDTESQAVSVAWSNDQSASSRQRGGSISGGFQGGSVPGGGSQGSGSSSQGSVEPAGVALCLLACEFE